MRVRGSREGEFGGRERARVQGGRWGGPGLRAVVGRHTTDVHPGGGTLRKHPTADTRRGRGGVKKSPPVGWKGYQQVHRRVLDTVGRSSLSEHMEGISVFRTHARYPHSGQTAQPQWTKQCHGHHRTPRVPKRTSPCEPAAQTHMFTSTRRSVMLRRKYQHSIIDCNAVGTTIDPKRFKPPKTAATSIQYGEARVSLSAQRVRRDMTATLHASYALPSCPSS